ncbi:efflux transporter outer membrane subunit [Iodidimonas sp. SYSU 1G8]|uniref:efflux transporter outer membrane subunit n=1 Tax=Iodidimonas sp. SYSU 1G8 TaxID=3133967 RepID=UPI0031FE6886
MFRPVAAVSIAALVAGCSLTPDYERPTSDVPPAWSTAVPTALAAEADQAAGIDAAWWDLFGDPALSSLMRDALASNYDLTASLERIEQARASVKVAGSALLPAIDGSAGLSRRTDQPFGNAASSNNYSASVAASYELDLWGRNRARVAGAKAGYEVSVFDFQSLKLVVQSDVATFYVGILALRERLDLARQNLAAARDLLNLVELRYREGAISGLDVSQQRGAIASFEAQIPSLEQQLKASEHALALLAGRTPQGFSVAETALANLALPAIAVEQPSQLLLRRPDLRSAEQSLIAANADIGIARAAFFPTISLSANGGLSGTISPDATSTFISLASGLAAPIFRGGELTGSLERTKARQRELVALYRQAVITAFAEVEDALIAVQTTDVRYRYLVESAVQARETYRLAQVRYKEGADDFLAVIDAQRNLFSAEDTLVDAQVARYEAAIALFKAMAGGWSAAG